jgi:subtilisin-like proprotein convertase family protein
MRKCFLLAAAVVATSVAAPLARAQLFFSNSAPINIPDSGTSSTYPSTIQVTGGPTTINTIAVTLNNLSHTFVSDVNVLLVSPSGTGVILMCHVGGGAGSQNATLKFIPNGTVSLPTVTQALISGVYRCTVRNPPAAFPIPAPAGPYNSSLSPLLGSDANGTWRLYVWDDLAGDSGTIAGGWSIDFSNGPPYSVSTAFTYQGVLSANGTPIAG